MHFPHTEQWEGGCHTKSIFPWLDLFPPSYLTPIARHASLAIACVFPPRNRNTRHLLTLVLIKTGSAEQSDRLWFKPNTSEPLFPFSTVSLLPRCHPSLPRHIRAGDSHFSDLTSCKKKKKKAEGTARFVSADLSRPPCLRATKTTSSSSQRQCALIRRFINYAMPPFNYLSSGELILTCEERVHRQPCSFFLFILFFSPPRWRMFDTLLKSSQSSLEVLNSSLRNWCKTRKIMPC